MPIISANGLVYTVFMADDTRLLSKQMAVGLGAVSLLILLAISTLLLAGVHTIEQNAFGIYFAFISNGFIVPILLMLAVERERFKLPALVWFHATMAVMILFFGETYSPFTSSWAILILIASTYYGWRGFAASSSALVVTAVLFVVMFAGSLESVLTYALLSLVVVTLTIFMSFLFVRVTTNSRRQTRELAKAQQSEQLQVNRLNTLLNSISDAVMTLNRYGRITSQNAAAQAFFDTNQSLIGREIDQLMNLSDEDEKQVSMHNLISNIKSTLLRDDLSIVISEETRHISLQMSRIRSTFGDNEEYGVVLIIRDITKQKTLEEEKDEFISVTSHELRTPVAIAEGSLSNLLVMYERHVAEGKLREAAEMAHDQIIYLAKMINDLSTLSRAERGVGDGVESINIATMFHTLYERYKVEAEKKGLHLNLELGANLPEVQTSRLYLEEILQNFVTNSIKYTKQGKVTLGAKMMPDSTIRFSVSDTGIGMSKSDLEHIFEKFYRSEDYRTRETSGTGLGLYVVEKLAAKLDTKIEVQSRLNHGSTFSFVLAAEAADADDNSVAEVEKIAESVV